MEQLSRRLRTIADYVPSGSRLADIGSDHALLPTYLAARGTIALAIAGELNAGPCEAARRQVQKCGLEHKVAVRRGDGLAVVEPGEVDVVVIAGMGGALIAAILEAGAAKLAGVARLILQPNVAEDQVRRWLMANGWRLADEAIVEEDGRFYEVLVAERADDPGRADESYRDAVLPCGLVAGEELLMKMGPLLIRRPTATFLRRWEAEAEKLEAICRRIEGAGSSGQAQGRLQELSREAAQIREVLACLRTDKR
jgi:tRNA (adenine22-N1)-methyltransferase